WAGAALLGWIVGEVIATDPVILNYLVARFGQEGAHYIELFSALTGAILVLLVGGYWRRNKLGERGEKAHAAEENLVSPRWPRRRRVRGGEGDRAPARFAGPHRCFCLSARLPVHLRARGGNPRYAYGRALPRRSRQRVYGRRRVRQGRALCRTGASSGPAHESPSPQGREGGRRVADDLLGRCARSGGGEIHRR